MKTLLLTSAGMQVKDEILKILPKPAGQIKLAHIITASKVEKDTSYVEEDNKGLREVGFQIEDIDIEGKNESELREILEGFDVIYVQGGNTFYLLKWMRESGFDVIVKELIDRGVLYIGVSAGSIIMGPTIEVAGWKDFDRNDVGLQDLTAFNLVPFNIFVHYSSEYEELVREEVPKSRYPVRILTNDQAFLVQDDKATLVGRGEEIKI